MKNLTKKIHWSLICSFSLLFIGFNTSLAAQEEVTETKKVVIITKKIDKDGKETIERIEKEGEEVNDEMIDRMIEEAKKSGKSVDIRIEKESQKIIKNRKGEAIKEMEMEIDGETIDLEDIGEVKDIMIFKTDDGKIIEITEEEGDEVEVTVTVDEEGNKKVIKKRKKKGAKKQKGKKSAEEHLTIIKTDDGKTIKIDESDKKEVEVQVTVDEEGNKKMIKKTKKIIKTDDGKEVIIIEEDDMDDGEVNVWVDDKGNKTIIKKESKIVLKSNDVEAKLKELNITLPVLGAPVANYVHAVTSNNWVFLAGKGPRKPDGKNVVGKLGKDLAVEEGYEAARWAGINLLAALKGEIGDLNRVVRIVKVKGMVNATPEFTDHSKVINGFSDLMVEVFGDKGKHARAAVGMNSLPGNMAVEIEVVVEIE